MHRLFISFNRQDWEKVFKIKKQIESTLGEKCWMDLEDIERGDFAQQTLHAIEVAKAVIFISSENSNSSINVIREIGYAVNMNKPILPLILDEAPYAKSIRLDISDIDQIDFKNPMASSKKLITS